MSDKTFTMRVCVYMKGCYQMIEVFAFQYGAIIAGLSLLLICYMVSVCVFGLLGNIKIMLSDCITRACDLCHSYADYV